MPEGHVTYTSENLTEAVLARIRPDADPRMARIMTALVRHVHDFVREVELTPEEWEAGVAFLTELGRWCDDKRQEVILLSDILGVSMLVDAIAHRTHASVSETTVLGPFHRENPPRMVNGQNMSPGVAGEPLEVEVRILDEDGTPLEGAQVDAWHTSPEGYYDSQLGDEHNMRGRFVTGPDGVVARWAACSPRWGAARCGRPTCISGSRSPATATSSPTSSATATPICMRMRCSA